MLEETFEKGDLLEVVSWAERLDPPWHLENIGGEYIRHPYAGQKVLFLLTDNEYFAKILGSDGVELIAKEFLRRG
tara:strand:- start:176 stop:400 length:225 start_codon:yes stop_codon:yes gene_type:complete